MTSKYRRTKRPDHYSKNGQVKIIRPARPNTLKIAGAISKFSPPLLPYSFYKNFTYPSQWNRFLKESIRRRDVYICQICHFKVNKYTSAIHHINYDKRDCSELNLITLCRRCHDKTRDNRQLWYRYLFKLIRTGLPGIS